MDKAFLHTPMDLGQRFEITGELSKVMNLLDTISMDKFWVVWRDKGGIPTTKHHSKDKAIAEADRLAAKETGTQFHVLEVVETIKSTAILSHIKYVGGDNG